MIAVVKRRALLRGLASAVAIGLAPAFLNKTRLALAAIGDAYDDPADLPTYLWRSKWGPIGGPWEGVLRVWLDGELIHDSTHPIVDQGVDVMASVAAAGASDQIGQGRYYHVVPHEVLDAD